MDCEELDTLCIKDQTLTNESMLYLRYIKTSFGFVLFGVIFYNIFIVSCVAGSEKVVGWALSHHLMQNPEADPETRVVLSAER